MKILQLINKPQLRGVEIFTAQVSNHLQALGHEVKIISLFPGEARLPFRGEVIHLNRPLGKRLMDVRGWKMLNKIIQEEKPDIVQANAGNTLKFAVWSKVWFGWKAPIVYRNASMVSSYITNPVTKFFNRWLYKRVAYIISVTHQSRNDLNGLFPFTLKKSGVIPIGVESLLPAGEILKSRTPMLLHVGGYTFEKNHAGVLRIFGQVKKQFPEAGLWLAGDGPLKKETERQVEAMGWVGDVDFLGDIANPTDYMQAADVLVLPSIIEGLPAVVLEAMQSSCVVVAYDVGGICEVVEDGVTGLLVAPGDEEGFVKAIVRVFENEALRREMIYHALEKVKGFRNEEIAKTFEGVYHPLAIRNEE